MKPADLYPLLLCALLAFACKSEPAASPQPAAPTEGPESYSAPPNRSDVAEQMRTARAVSHAPSDGGGRAWIESGPSQVSVGSPASWTFGFEAGPEGVAEGGRIVFMVSPFWGWSPPQDRDERGPGFTTVRTDAPEVTLGAETSGSPMMGITVGGRGLRAGERIFIDYGGAAGARVDRFADARSRFWIGVDGDGDGTHVFLESSPAVAVAAGPPTRLAVIAPTTVPERAEFSLAISFLDGNGSAGTSFAGTLTVESEPAGVEVPAQITIGPTDRGHRAVTLTAPESGTFRIRVRAEPGFDQLSNPIVVTPKDAPGIFWGDLHGHSGLSDGTGTAQDYFRYARDVAALDVVALTDHDHWGVVKLDDTPAMWSEIRHQAKAFHQPGKFVALLGYEWTSWEYGHRHVLYFGDDGDVISSIDLDHNTPDELWNALRGKNAITVAHHSAGGPIATDWSFAPDPQLEPVTEVVSVHGVSEALDSPSVIYDPQPGNFVRDALALGYRFGFVGSGDSHDGHPGLAQLANGGTGGLAAIVAKDLTRPAILEAIRERRVYATSGPRIYLRSALGTFPMGSVVTLDDLTADGNVPSLYVRVVGTAEIRWLDIVRSGHVARNEVNVPELELLVPVEDLRAGDYVYVRIVQADGGLAWSSPVYVVESTNAKSETADERS